MDKGNKWVKFVDASRPHLKTKHVEVRGVGGDTLLGTIAWFGRWRQYAFYPESLTIFSDSCLDAVKREVQRLNLERKGGK